MFEQIAKIRQEAKELKPWGGPKDLWVGLILSSFFINILSLVFPLVLLQVYNRILPNSALHTLLLLVLAVGCALILETILRIARSIVTAWGDARHEQVLGCQAFKQILQCSIVSFEEEGSGKYFERINAVNTLKEFYGGQAIIAMIDLPFVLLFIILMAYIAGTVVIIPIAMLFIFGYQTLRLGEHLKSILTDRRISDDRRMNFLIQTLQGIHTVKSMAMEAQMLRRYERLQKKSQEHDYSLSTASSRAANISMIANQATVVLLVSYGSILVIHNRITIGALAACIILAGRILQPVSRMIGVWSRLQSIQLAQVRLNEIAKLPTEAGSNSADFPPIVGDIEFKEVSFKYPDADKFLLDNINIQFKPGETVCITGNAQSGKTTLVWLIMGGMQPTKGKILIDGKDIANYNPDSIRQQIAYLPENGALFEGTIMENLTLFNNSLEYIDKAKKIVEDLQLDYVIHHMPRGFETKVGNRAVEYTPRGVIQRICIARAFINSPKLILFDEASMNMDRKANLVFIDYLKKVKTTHTTILLTHNEDYFAIADKIYMLSNGKLELMQKSP